MECRGCANQRMRGSAERSADHAEDHDHGGARKRGMAIE
uniref:Uncharacterized protein n=1 Tax=Arundo donax TaxID=35708 RepID=A0A0A9AAM5_ARUDO